jgi:hypothetical protein
VEDHLGDGWLFLVAHFGCRGLAWGDLSGANKVQIRFEYRQMSLEYGWNKARMKREYHCYQVLSSRAVDFRKVLFGKDLRRWLSRQSVIR